jgi:hypothetical protein
MNMINDVRNNNNNKGLCHRSDRQLYASRCKGTFGRTTSYAGTCGGNVLLGRFLSVLYTSPNHHPSKSPVSSTDEPK